MLRVVADTNTYVSAYNVGGLPGKFVELALQGKITLFVSAPILHELERVLSEKFAWPEELVFRAVTNILEFTHLVIPERQLAVIADDPTDDRVLECALQAHADVIVSGDAHLLKLKEFRGIVIMKTSTFLRRP